MDKYDVKKAHRDLYSASAADFAVVEVPELQYLALDGRGDPNTSKAFEEAVGALYGMSYTLKFTSKNTLGRDFVVAPLEGLWRAEDQHAFAEMRKESWEWTLLVNQPEWITEAMVADAAAAAAEKHPNPALDQVRLLALTEGTCVQILHVGSYESESATLERMHREFMLERGLVFNGDHHEIYLSDPRRTAEANLKTILRQPVRPADLPSQPPGPVGVQHDRVDRVGGGDEEPIALRAAEDQVRHGGLRDRQRREVRAVGVEAVDVRRGGPHPALDVDPQAVEAPARGLREHLTAAELPTVHVEAADVAAGRVGDVEHGLVGGEGEPVGPLEVVRDALDRARGRVYAVHVAAVDLRLRAVALVVAGDPVRRVGEPDRAVARDDHVVGAVEPLALPAVGDHRDRTVQFGPLDPPLAVRAGHEPPLPVEGVAVRVPGGGAEDAHRAVRLIPAHDPVVRDVAEQQVPPRGHVDRALGPTPAGEEAFEVVVAGDGEALVEFSETNRSIVHRNSSI
jgi:hypothetical protein